MSSNINSGTPIFSNVASYPFRQPERVFFNPSNANEMWVSSFGNGMKMGLINVIGVPEFSEEEFSVYPNPASSFVTVIASEAKQSQLFNAYGQEIRNQKLIAGKNEINVSDLSNGIYFLKIGNTAKKIVVSK